MYLPCFNHKSKVAPKSSILNQLFPDDLVTLHSAYHTSEPNVFVLYMKKSYISYLNLIEAMHLIMSLCY